MSSQWKSYTSSDNAVDGNTDPNVNGQSCAVTSAQTNPWLRIDLKEPQKVSENVYKFLLFNTFVSQFYFLIRRFIFATTGGFIIDTQSLSYTYNLYYNLKNQQIFTRNELQKEL
jgi:hypothetical protein